MYGQRGSNDNQLVSLFSLKQLVFRLKVKQVIVVIEWENQKSALFRIKKQTGLKKVGVPISYRRSLDVDMIYRLKILGQLQ